MNITFEQVLDALANDETILAGLWAGALSQLSPQQVETFVARLDTVRDDRRRELIEQLVLSAEDDFSVDFTDLLRPLLDDRDPEVRRLAIHGLWEDERPDLVELLLKALAHDPATSVRAEAAGSLGHFVFLAECEEIPERLAARIRRTLEGVLNDPHEELDVARRALEAIAFINDGGVSAIIRRAYHDDRLPMRAAAVFAMGRSADADWADLVLDELASDEPLMRYEAGRAAAEMQLRRAVRYLVPMCADPDTDMRDMAIWALGQIGGEAAEDALTALAASDNEEVAAAADEALGDLPFAEANFELMNIPDSELFADEEGPDDDDWDEDEEDGDEEEGDDEDEDDEPTDDEAEWPDEFLDLGH